MRRAHIALAAGCLAAVLSACRGGSSDADPLRALARWEDQRRAPLDSLATLIAADDPAVRLAAVRAAGLIGDFRARPALATALADPAPSVRAQAAFSLGVLGDTTAVEALARCLRDPDILVRESALDGLALLDHDGRELLPAARGGDTGEAIEAWDALIHLAASCDRDSLNRAIAAGLARPQDEIRWRALRCAQRAPDSTRVAAIAPLAADANPQVRAHAIRALGQLPGTLELILDTAKAATPDWLPRDSARCEVARLRALATLAGPALADSTYRRGDETVALIAGAAGADDPGVVREALAAIAAAARPQLKSTWRAQLAAAARTRLTTGSGAVRAAAIEATGALLGRAWDRDVAISLGDDPAVVAAWLLACGRHGSSSGDAPPVWATARDILSRPDLYPPHLRATAAEALAAAFANRRQIYPADSGQQRSLAREAYTALVDRGLLDPDFVVRATTATALADFPLGWTLTAIQIAFTTAAALPEGRQDVQLACLDAVEGIHRAGQDSARVAELRSLKLAPIDEPRLYDLAPRAAGTTAILRAALADPDLRLRLRARAVALATGLIPAAEIPAEADLRASLPPMARSPLQPPVQSPFAAPRVRCVTDHGAFVIQLDGEVAPNTCVALLAQIDAGLHADGVFHRVVPDFVIQGGDPRGDGWGGPGYTLRCEYSRRRFERGTVGIAHSGKDSGGSQWFVCHSPQPHLDGRYPVVGTVVAGLEVIDAIDQGDRFRLERE